VLQTVSGIHKDCLSLHRAEEMLLLFPVTFIVPLVVDNQVAAIVAPTAFNLLLNLLEDLLRSKSLHMGSILLRNFLLGVFSFLWANHIYVLKQHDSSEIYTFVLSAICILTSIYTVARLSVREFSANGFENEEVGWGSTLYMRLFLALPTLTAEFVLYNTSLTSMDPLSDPLLFLPRLNCFLFLTWWMGWLSSLGSTLQLVLNKIGTIVLGNQSEWSLGGALLGVVVNLVPIAIYEIILNRGGQITLTPLIVGASLTSFFTFVHYNFFWDRVSSSFLRSGFFLMFEALVCALLVALYYRADLSSVTL
jgi:uncharacterized membrane protein YecN with MAPEG domain